MKTYHFDRDTGEYLGETASQIDPMASRREGKEVYLLPAHATFDEPLSPKEGNKIIFADGAWQYVEINTEPTPEEIQAEKERQAEQAIQEEMARILREQAIKNLVAKGIITEGEECQI